MTMSLIAPPPARRPLGSSDIEVSAMAWGSWRFAGNDVRAACRKIEAALAAGITLFDTADVYGLDYGEPFGAAETMLGRIRAAAPDLASEMVISTKGGIRPGVPYDSSAEYLAVAIDASLKRLGVERIDLWQIHRPDILAHPAEIAEALTKAHAAGKVRAIGLSNVTAQQSRMLRHHLPLPIVSHQPEFSALALDPIDNGLLDQALEQDMAILAWSPLGGGRIATPRTPREQDVAAALDAQAGQTGVDRTVVAYSWLMAHPARPIPIIGTQKPERIAEAAAALTISWSRREWYAVLEASRGEQLP